MQGALNTFKRKSENSRIDFALTSIKKPTGILDSLKECKAVILDFGIFLQGFH